MKHNIINGILWMMLPLVYLYYGAMDLELLSIIAMIGFMVNVLLIIIFSDSSHKKQEVKE